MIRTALASTVAGTVLLLPAPADATFFPGTEPPVEYTCSAMSVRANVGGDCTAGLAKSVESRTDLVGTAVVTTKGADLGFTGDGTSTATATATVDSTHVLAAGGLLNVQVDGATTSQHVACGHGNEFTGGSHVDRLVINGKTYTDLTSGEFVTPFGTVSVGTSARDYYDSSFDALEGGWQTAVVVKAGLATVKVASVGVMVYGFPC
jgi:hypothetical protein